MRRLLAVQEYQAKFKSAMIYPIMVICVGLGIMAFFMFFMMPRFTEIFMGFNIELPLPTRTRESLLMTWPASRSPTRISTRRGPPGAIWPPPGEACSGR